MTLSRQPTTPLSLTLPPPGGTDTPQRGPRAHVLIVDDDPAMCALLAKSLRADGYAITTAKDGVDALIEVDRVAPDIVLTDLQMPVVGGVELCRRLHEIDRDLPVIVMTGAWDMSSVIASMRAGAEDYLFKPLHHEAIVLSVERAIARREARREQDELMRTLNQRLVLSSVREQEHAEAEARHRAQLNALFENLSEGVLIAEQGPRVLMLNEAGRSILGLDLDQTADLGMLYADELFDREGNPLAEDQRPLIRALRGEGFTGCEVIRRSETGERRRIVASGTSVKDEDGEIAMAIVVFRDVTELRRLEQQREELLALISHDLRAPLSAILMAVSLLKVAVQQNGDASGVPLAARVSFADRAERNVERMMAMLDELSEATSLESNPHVHRRVPADLRTLVVDAVEGVDDIRTPRITMHVEDEDSWIVLADAPRLERVVTNLLTNALKYSAKDAPVGVCLVRRGADVVLEVRDHGIGIAPESLRMLFDRYYRTAGGQARAAGLGLGLYIARLVVEAHGGHIEVSSEVGKGSSFQVSLPAYVPETSRV
jgi:PAS domain S-box-containing protein